MLHVLGFFAELLSYHVSWLLTIDIVGSYA
jgi:hypothetical protein